LYDIFGQALFTDHFTNKQKGTQDFKVLTNEAFYPFGDAESDCFTVNKEELNPINENFTFGVHMNTREAAGVDGPVAGSLCDELLHTQCIFCGEIRTIHNQ